MSVHGPKDGATDIEVSADAQPEAAIQTRDAVPATYVAILTALAIAGAMSTGRLVESAERLPFGPARERFVSLAIEVHAAASRAGFDRPAEMIEAVRASAERAEPIIAAQASKAFDRSVLAVRTNLTSAGTGAPALIARSIRADRETHGSSQDMSLPVPAEAGTPGVESPSFGDTGDLEPDSARSEASDESGAGSGSAGGEAAGSNVDRNGETQDADAGSSDSAPAGAESDSQGQDRISGLGSVPGLGPDLDPSPGPSPGLGLDNPPRTLTDGLDSPAPAPAPGADEGSRGMESPSDPAAGVSAATERVRRLAEAEAGANGEWMPSISDGSASGRRAAAIRAAREIASIAAQVPAPRRLDSRVPLRVHVAGDSMAQPLGYALQRLVVDDPRVAVTLDFKISTGLVRPDYFDWLERIAMTLDPRFGQPNGPKPEVIVFFVGGNENQNMRVGIREVLLVGTPEWAEAYAERAARIMDIAGRGGSRVVWIGMPVIRDPAFNAAALRVNQTVSKAAEVRPWVHFVDIWAMFSGPDGDFAPFLPGPDGAPIQVRDEDGIHLSSDGTRVVGDEVFSVLGAVWDVRTPTPTSTATSTPTSTATSTPTSTTVPTPIVSPASIGRSTPIGSPTPAP